MPKRRQQCAFKEGRIRCRRDGVGNPPLCTPHRMVVEEEARRAANPPPNSIWSVVEDFLHGRPIDRGKVAAAIHEVVGGFEADPYHTDTNEFEHERRNRTRAPGDREYSAPPMRDELAGKREALRKAKVALGFAADEPVTRERLKQRQRELAKRFHPDRPGGSLEKMQAVNSAVDLIEQAL